MIRHTCIIHSRVFKPLDRAFLLRRDRQLNSINLILRAFDFPRNFARLAEPLEQQSRVQVGFEPSHARLGLELSPAHLWHDIKEHARLRFPTGIAALQYNVLQKLAYGSVLLVLLPMVILLMLEN